MEDILKDKEAIDEICDKLNTVDRLLLKSSTTQLNMMEKIMSKVDTIDEVYATERKLSLQNEQLQYQINQM